MSTIRIASFYGLGDTYLVASLAGALRAHYPDVDEVVLQVKKSHADLARMFPGISVQEVDDEEATGISRRLWESGRVQEPGDYREILYAHPNHVRVRPDHCVAHGRMSDAAMYALILGLHPATQPALPTVPHTWRQEAREIADRFGIRRGKTVLLIDEARSWTPPRVSFWTRLAGALDKVGWYPLFNDPGEIPLRCVIPLVEFCGWVVGANCGLMQAIVSYRARCRKTIVTREVYPYDPEGPHINLPFLSAGEYRSTRSVDGYVYDVEEFVVDSRTETQIVSLIATGRNARGSWFGPDPVPFVDWRLSPGDVADKLALARVKQRGLPEEKRGEIEAEIWRLQQWLDRFTTIPGVAGLARELEELNQVAWDANEILIQAYADPGYADEYWSLREHNVADVAAADVHLKAFGRAHRANQKRVRVRNEINMLCGSPAREDKTYET